MIRKYWHIECDSGAAGECEAQMLFDPHMRRRDVVVALETCEWLVIDNGQTYCSACALLSEIAKKSAV